MKIKNEERIRKQIKDIKSRTETSFTKKELNELPKIINENEDILYFTSGFHKSNNNSMIIVLTTKRIIFLDNGMFVSRRQFDIPLDMVNSVQLYTGLILGEITIVYGEYSETIKDIVKESAIVFQQTASKEMEKYKQKNKYNKHSEKISKNTNGYTKNKYILINDVYINCSSIIEIKKEENCIVISTIKKDYYAEYDDKRYNDIISFIADDIFEC
ncbi:PH domain-containing protein [uncultured Brachyspira sp.]|uniref:PH domain-containing protein n=1 Tax=uncultured Brachyspira sp. TaxID=221953 RepID=UPI0025F6F213|nr:PH domain-containing protein [uncultured Brachyspira sp.]